MKVDMKEVRVIRKTKNNQRRRVNKKKKMENPKMLKKV
jgi:hypothetical protein